MNDGFDGDWAISFSLYNNGRSGRFYLDVTEIKVNFNFFGWEKRN